jgi:CPA1 family monovalent cation:H+ antiporter
MPETLELSTILALFIGLALLSAVARVLGAASPFVMLVGGVAIAFIPGFPAITLDPDLVLLGLLPPLIYSSAVGMSWRGFRSNLRPILLLAIGCVLFTAGAVAAVAHYGLGLSWTVGFVLGAIVSPPDSVTPMALLRSIRLPRRLLTVLEGESLVNDATALVTLSFALEALGSGKFSPGAVAVRFLLIVGGEAAFGCMIAFVMLRLRHFVADARAEVLLALATPFLTFWPPHELGGSGVVSCVAAGLYVSWNGRNYIRPATRLQGYFIWSLVTWCIEALAFLVCGLQTRTIVANLSSTGWPALLMAGALTSVTVIVVRFIWVFPVTYLPRWLWPPLRKREPPPNWKPAFLIGYTGLRGAVSLAAALSVPLTAGGLPFPQRDLILFTTICVIVATLVIQGAALTRVAQWLGLGHAGAREAASNRRGENAARVKGVEAALALLDQTEKAAGKPSPAIEALRRLEYERRANFIVGTGEAQEGVPVAVVNALRLDLIDAERMAYSAEYEQNRITDEARRRIERELDLEEASIRHSLTRDSSDGVASG